MLYMDVINEINVLEDDFKQVNEKCGRVNCAVLYDAIAATLNFCMI